jgi:Cof subfamily protein (haloacid dehalogenase superfamily)
MVDVPRRYRLLVTDVDGTLLPPDRRVLPAVREALRAVRDRGVRVCLATGRMWRSVRPYVEAVGADSPVVLYNGAVVYDFHADRVLEYHTLDPDGLRAALEVLREFPDVRPHVFAQERVYVDRLDPQSRAYLERDGITAEEVGDLVEACAGGATVAKTHRGGLDTVPRDPVKVLVVGDPERLLSLEGELARRAPTVRRVFSERDFLELLPWGVSKGTALRTVCAVLGVPLHEVVAVGDNPNDLEMLQAAGLGVAVGNAHPAVREAAGYVTRAPGGEALVEVAERFLLNGSPDNPKGR